MVQIGAAGAAFQDKAESEQKNQRQEIPSLIVTTYKSIHEKILRIIAKSHSFGNF